jgi:nucleoside-diphosphate-sugar epimerase
MRIAVTGATGFVGKHIVEHLKKAGNSVIAIGRDIKKLKAVFNKDIDVRESDYSLTSLTDVMDSADAIVHLAGKRSQRDLDPMLISPYIEDNLLLTENLLKAAQHLNIRRVSQSSTIAVYSKLNTLPFVETQFPHAISMYGVSKLACEHLANFFSNRTPVQVTNLRLSSMYGTGEKTGLVFTDYLNLARQKKTLEIWGKGETRIDFLYIKDAVVAIEKSLHPTTPVGTYNIGSGTSYSVKELAEAINKVYDNEGNLRLKTEKKVVPYQIYMDISKANSELNWKPVWKLENALNDLKADNTF